MLVIPATLMEGTPEDNPVGALICQYIAGSNPADCRATISIFL